MSYLYVKSPPRSVGPKRVISPSHKKYFASFFLFSGIFLFLSAILPILQFQLGYSTKFNQILNPLSPQFYNHPGSVLDDINTDYTQLSNWFVNDPGQDISSPLPNYSLSSYYVSIPKLRIKDAQVIIGSTDLKKSLIHYPKTALPGQYGSPVIFGHSVLPQFFNPESYLTIFSTLYKLKQGDEIFVNYDQIQYKYLVEEMYEVQPTDLSVLEQRFDGRYITLITCSPPGTYLRRLIIKGRIADNP